MTQYGPLINVDSDSVVVDPRFGTEQNPEMPESWVVVDPRFGTEQNPEMPESWAEAIDAEPSTKLMTESSRQYRSVLLPGGYPATHTGVYDEYEAIDHQGLMTSRSIGQDDLGNTMRVYQIRQPDVNSQWFDQSKLKIAIISGIHGQERTPVTGLHAFIKDLVENRSGNELFRQILATCDIQVLPVATPSGWDAGTRVNANGVNINRNFTTEWSEDQTNPGTGPASEPETQNIETWLAQEGFDFFVDVHNTVGPDNPWVQANPDLPEGMALIRDYAQSESVLHRWWLERDDVAYMAEGPLTRIQHWGGQLAQTNVHAQGIGIPHVVLLEVAHVYSPDTTPTGPVSNTFSAESIGNFFMTALDRLLRDQQRTGDQP